MPGRSRAFLLSFLAIPVLSLAFKIDGQAADVVSGNAILPGCRDHIERKGSFSGGECVGAVHTLMTMRENLLPGLRHCMPDEITIEQAVRVVVTYMEKNAQRTHERFVDLALAAFQDAWPCPR